MGKATVTVESATAEAVAALEAVVNRHVVRDGCACQECGHLWPCFTTRAVMHVIGMMAATE